MAIETRTASQIRHHYQVETELANKLRNASKADRLRLYSEVYDELFSRVPDIPHLGRKADETSRIKEVEGQFRFLEKFLRTDQTFLEIGPGDCRLSIRIAAKVARVFSVDVTNEIAKHIRFPENVTFKISDGCSIPIPKNSVDIAYSDQLIEHLHPDDALDHLRNVCDSLAPGGQYICVTPNRLYGPHDISKYFDENATGLHLREYSVSELARLFTEAGFSDVNGYTFTQRFQRIRVPLPLVQIIESGLSQLPRRASVGLACSSLLKPLMRTRVVGVK